MDRPSGIRVPEQVAPPPRAPSPTNPPAAESVGSHLGLARRDQFVLGFLSVILLVLMAVYAVRLSNWGRTPVEIEHLPSHAYEFRLDINSATWVEFGQLDGIGDVLAHRIVADREKNGPFRSIDDLRRVKGIGPKILEKLRPWLQVDHGPADSLTSDDHRAAGHGL